VLLLLSGTAVLVSTRSPAVLRAAHTICVVRVQRESMIEAVAELVLATSSSDEYYLLLHVTDDCVE
jgi:hypothetical protein